MFKLIRKHPCPKWYDLFLACHTHGWINLAPFSWDKQQNQLLFPLLIDRQAVDVAIRQKRDFIFTNICSKKKIESASINRIDALLARILNLNEDITELFKIASKIGSPYPAMMRKGAGRLLHGATLWEDAAKTLFTTNCSWTLTQKMCEKLCSSTFSISAPSGRYPFPNPSSLAGESLDDLKKKMPIGYRAEYLKLLSIAFSQNSPITTIEKKGYSYDSVYKIVSDLRGYGRYASTHLLILAGYYEKIPVDSETMNYFKINYSIQKTQRFIDRRYAPWGRYRWWGFKFEKMLRRQNWLGD